MEVYIEKEKKTINYDKSCTVDELLNYLGINSSTVIVAKNDEIVLPDEELSETDNVKILSVVSGG